jgi:predicted HicB family RNase H-like nuclease
MTRINIELKDDVHRKAKVVCAMKGITLIEYINQALKERVKKDGS